MKLKKNEEKLKVEGWNRKKKLKIKKKEPKKGTT
jgi:hypothetical protein